MCEYMILEDYTMEQYIYNEQNSLWYELRGDYYLPCLELPSEKEEQPIVIWGSGVRGISVSIKRRFIPAF